MNGKYVFHHYDLDGYVGGSIAMASLHGFTPVSCSYDDRVRPLEMVKPGDDVVLIDYSFLPDEMKWMKDNCNTFVWIDHHVSAIRLAEENGYADAFGVRRSGKSGAELAWEVFFGRMPLHRFVEMVGEYDTFRNSDAPEFLSEVVPFFYGTQTLMQEELNPADTSDNVMSTVKEGDARLSEALDAMLHECLERGQVIAKYNLEKYRSENEESCYVRKLFGGLRCLCLNASGHDGSLQLTLPGTYDPSVHDMMVVYSYNGKTGKWSYGFYSDGHPEVDCSKIAEEFGGGGHRGAAGATTEKLIEGLA